MILPDVNLLLNAYNTTSPFHDPCTAWWSKCLAGPEPVALCPVVLFGFVRIATSPRIFTHPLTIEKASSHVQEWLEQPTAQLAETETQDIHRALSLLTAAGTGGKLTTDAQIAALALRLGATVHSADADYARFHGVRWFNPLNAKYRK